MSYLIECEGDGCKNIERLPEMYDYAEVGNSLYDGSILLPIGWSKIIRTEERKISRNIVRKHMMRPGPPGYRRVPVLQDDLAHLGLVGDDPIQELTAEELAGDLDSRISHCSSYVLCAECSERLPKPRDKAEPLAYSIQQ